MAQKIRFKRILLKLSGETLGGKGGFGIDTKAAEYVAREVVSARALGCEIAIVIGGGNLIRGGKLSPMGIYPATEGPRGRLVVFAGGTGSPYFSTDTAAALRASEIKADAILKATNVRGVFAADPKKNKRAKFIREINPLEMVKKDLRVMDLTAVALSMENKIPVIVFDAFKKGNLVKIIRGEKIGSEIRVH